MDYTPEQIEEIKRIQKTMKQMEGILKISSNAEQKNRVGKDFNKLKKRLAELCPDGIPEFEAVSGGQVEEVTDDFPTISKFTPKKASEHCEDKDINLLSTLMEVFEREYWPALSSIDLDYSNQSEKDSFYTHLEESKRNLKILTETIEEHSTSPNAEFREQLFKMKNKQTRIYLYETITIFRKLKDFSSKLVDDVQNSGNIIMNKPNKNIAIKESLP